MPKIHHHLYEILGARHRICKTFLGENYFSVINRILQTSKRYMISSASHTIIEYLNIGSFA